MEPLQFFLEYIFLLPAQPQGSHELPLRLGRTIDLKERIHADKVVKRQALSV